MASKFSDAYSELRGALIKGAFSSDKKWKSLIENAKKLTQDVKGFDLGQKGLPSDLRKRLKKEGSAGQDEAVALYEAVGGKPTGPVGGELSKRLAALKTLRHTYFLKKMGGHKVWIVSIPDSFSEWPHDALRGGVNGVTAKLLDKSERFSTEDKKHLSNASQEGLKWVHKAMIVTSKPKKAKNAKLIRRWFSDGDSKDADINAAASTLNAGLKKIAFRLKSGSLIYTDSVSERGTAENANTEAFVWGDRLDVVYIEEEFFGTRNTLSGLTNWARIVVHELTHREVSTKDHAYEWAGISPKVLTAAKAIENADSWAWFCADCAGALTKSQVSNALV